MQYQISRRLGKIPFVRLFKKNALASVLFVFLLMASLVIIGLVEFILVMGVC